MAADNENSQLKQSLNKRLVLLQGESAAVQTLVAQTNQREYANLSAIYLWWRSAATIEGYLEEALKPTLSRRVHNHANDGTSFRRLLYLMYGNYGIDKDDLDRKNAVLCGLHSEYEKNKPLYAKDGVNKLAGYIKAQGGVHGVINTIQPVVAAATAITSPIQAPAVVASTIATGATNSQVKSHSPVVPQQNNQIYQTYKTRIQVKITDIMRQSALLKEAEAYFSKQSSSQQLTITPPIVTNNDGYGLALVKRTNSQFNLIGADTNIYGIRELLVNAYRKQYEALPASMRCFFEIIKTQSLPSNLQKYYDKLTELSAEKHDDNTRKRIHRRVMYLASENMLVLSPSYARSGVVTLAKLKANPFDGGANDCFMPTRCRKMIEQRMLSQHDFNLYAPNNSSTVPRFNREGLAAHMLRLENKADKGDFAFVEFWNFEEEMGAANEQLFFASSYKLSCRQRISVAKIDIQTLAYDHINLWLDSYGDHITRPANQLIEFAITRDGFELGFDFVNRSFRNRSTSLFATQSATAIDYEATFLAKDLCLALHSIGDLPLIGDIEIACSDDAMVLSYATDVADYTVAVPTTNGTRRNDDAFSVYSAAFTASRNEADDGVDDAMLIEAALAKSNQVLTDAAIDKLFEEELDDYDEILEGWEQQSYEAKNDVEWTDEQE